MRPPRLVTLGGFGLWWLFDIVRLGAAPTYAFQFKLHHAGALVPIGPIA